MKRILIIALVVFVRSVFAADYYVAKTGSDTNTGLSGSPWLTIQKALGTSRSPGDRINVSAGEYLEKLNFAQAGTVASNISLICATGTVLRGSVSITNWIHASSGDVRGNAHHTNIWYTYLTNSVFDNVIVDLSGNFYSSSPQIQIYVDSIWIPSSVNMARWPNGDVQSQTGDVYDWTTASTNGLTDSVRLIQATNFWDGALAVYYRRANDSSYERRVTGYDPALNQVTWTTPLPYPTTNSDRYFMLNNPGVIDEDFDFAVETSTRRLFMRFPDDPALHTVEVSVLNDAVTSEGSANFTMSGLSVIGFYRQGIWFREGANVTITNCLVDRNNRDYTFSYSHMTNSQLLNSVFRGRGLTMSWGQSNRIYRCIGINSPVDALTVTYYETGSTVEESAFLEAWQNSHPDGFQTYVNPTNTALKSVLWFNSGQHWQAADTYYSKATNCLWALNHWSGGISMSGTRHNFSNEWNNCTFYSANATKDFSSGNYASLYDSIVIPIGSVGSSSATNQGFADRNLFWRWGNTFTLTYYTNDASGTVFTKTASSLTNYQATSGRDLNSVFADPLFSNAPLSLLVTDSAEFATNIFDRLYLTSTAGLTVGNVIEFNGDGVVRRITGVNSAYISFDPAYETNYYQRTYRFPDGQTRCFYWGANSNLQWDLRLAANSPGRSNVWSSEPVGSSIVITNYKNGDFDGDGNRDVPTLPGQTPLSSSLALLVTFESDFTGGVVSNLAGSSGNIQRFGFHAGTTNPVVAASNWIYAASVTNGNSVSTGARFSWRDGSGYGDYSKDGRYAGITNFQLGNLSQFTVMLWARYLPTEANTPLWTDEHNATLLTSGRYSVAGAWNFGRENFWENPLYANQTAFNFWVDAENTNRVQVPFPDTGDSLGSTDAMHHYAVVFNSGVISTFFDGVYYTNKSGSLTTIPVNGSPAYIGLGCWPHHGASTSRDPWLDEGSATYDQYPNNGWLNGTIDNLRIYTSALSGAEINAIYDAENGEAGGGGTNNYTGVGVLNAHTLTVGTLSP